MANTSLNAARVGFYFFRIQAHLPKAKSNKLPLIADVFVMVEGVNKYPPLLIGGKKTSNCSYEFDAEVEENLRRGETVFQFNFSDLDLGKRSTISFQYFI